MQDKIDKQKVKKGFEKSIATYKNHAVVQDFIAARLIREVENRSQGNFPRILEIGCGPGLLTEKVINHFSFGRYYANDIVDEYKSIIPLIHNKISFLPGDVERIELPENLDLVISSSTFQWLQDLEKFLFNLHSLLNHDGLLVFSSFGPENYREIKEVEGRGLDYIPYHRIQEMLSQHFEILWSDRELITRYFETPTDVLKHMKLTGVNGLPGNVWTRSDLERFEREYTNLYGNDIGVPLTYQPLYFIAKPRKKIK